MPGLKSLKASLCLVPVFCQNGSMNCGLDANTITTAVLHGQLPSPMPWQHPPRLVPPYHMPARMHASREGLEVIDR